MDKQSLRVSFEDDSGDPWGYSFRGDDDVSQRAEEFCSGNYPEQDGAKGTSGDPLGYSLRADDDVSQRAEESYWEYPEEDETIDTSGDPLGYSFRADDEESQRDNQSYLGNYKEQDETEVTSSDPWGYSGDDEESQRDQESYWNYPEQDDFAGLEVVVRQGRFSHITRRCFVRLLGIYVLLLVGVGLGIFFFDRQKSSRKATNTVTPYPTFSPTSRNATETISPYSTDAPTITPSFSSDDGFEERAGIFLEDKRAGYFFSEESEVNYTCYICGSEEGTISKPDTILSFLSSLDFQENTTCSDLDFFGRIEGSISPKECDILHSETQILKQCGCSNGDNIFDKGEPSVTEEEPLNPIFSSCPICGSGILKNPFATVSTLLPWGYVEDAACENLNAVGLTGFYPTQGCLDIQSSKEIIETCCSIVPSSNETSLDTPLDSLTPIEPKVLPFPPCFVCGSENDTISNPDSILSLATSLGYAGNTTCAGLNNIGKEGKISPEKCSVVQSQTEVVEQCGCSVIEKSSKERAKPGIY